MNDPSVYDYLAKQNLSDLTVENLHKMAKVSAIDPSNIEFWSGIITVARAIEESRCYANGLPIPETGTVLITSIADGATATITPPLTEIWLIQRIDLDSCSVGLKDADGNLCPVDLTVPYPSGPLYLTNTMSLIFSNASGGAQTPAISYFKVGL